MRLSVKSNVSTFTKLLSSKARQIPFATAGALNDTAFAVRKQVVERTYPRSFEVRNRSFPRTAFRVEKANKRKLQAAVYDRTESEWLSRQAFGGRKRAPGGGLVAIPTDAVRRTARGRVSAAQRPGAILNRRGIKIDTAAGGMILKKKRVFYFLRDSVRVPKRFPFAEDAKKSVQQTYRRNFTK